MIQSKYSTAALITSKSTLSFIVGFGLRGREQAKIISDKGNDYVAYLLFVAAKQKLINAMISMKGDTTRAEKIVVIK